MVHVHVQTYEEAISVPWIFELLHLQISQRLFRARILPYFVTCAAGPWFHTIARESTVLELFAATTIQARIVGANARCLLERRDRNLARARDWAGYLQRSFTSIAHKAWCTLTLESVLVVCQVDACGAVQAWISPTSQYYVRHSILQLFERRRWCSYAS